MPDKLIKKRKQLDDHLLNLFITEYEQIREDIRHIDQIEKNFFVLVNTLLVLVSGSEIVFSVDILRLPPGYYIIAAVVCASLGAAFVIMNFEMARLGLYLRTELVPSLRKAIHYSGVDVNDIWKWEEFRLAADKKFRLMPLMAAIQSLLLVFLTGAVLFLYFLNRTRGEFGFLDLGAIFAIGLILAVVGAAFSVTRLFLDSKAT